MKISYYVLSLLPFTFLGCGFASSNPSNTEGQACFEKPVQLQWDPVLQDTQGNPITVDGYRLYAGETSGGPYQPVHETQNATATVSLCPGTYYFVVTAFKNTQESPYSNEASKNLEGFNFNTSAETVVTIK